MYSNLGHDTMNCMTSCKIETRNDVDDDDDERMIISCDHPMITVSISQTQQRLRKHLCSKLD